MSDVIKAVIVFVVGTFALGGMFVMGRYVIDTLNANLTVYYPNVALIITATLTVMIALTIIFFGLKQATRKGGTRY